MFRTQWRVKTKFRKNRQIAGLRPNSAEVFEPNKWNEKRSENGPKLTILLDLALLPQTPSHLSIVGVTNPILLDPKESYWLSSLAALLTHIPHKSVDVIAFNIEHENEIFRQRDFDEEGYRRLSDALSKNKIGKFQASVVSQSHTLPAFLAGLVKQDEAEKDSGRIVIFVGPTAWLSRVEMPKDLKADFQNANTRLFYFQYYDPSVFGAENLEYNMSDIDTSLSPAEAMSAAPRYPNDGVWKGDKTSDSIDYLIKALGGQIVRVYSPEDFQQSIADVVERIKPTSN